MQFFRFFIGRLLPICCLSLIANGAMATQLVTQSTVSIQGHERRYFHLHDPEHPGDGPIILLLSGTGCDDFGSRFSKFFKKSVSSVDVYLLEKVGVTEGAVDYLKCSKKFVEADQLDRRVADNLAFLNTEPTLKKSGKHSIAVLGLSEGGPVALQIASKSEKIGWLAAAGSGGLQQSEEFLIFADRGVPPYANPLSRKQFLKTYAEIKQNKNNLEKEFFGHSYKYWASHLFFDPLPIYAGLNIPIVVAMGERDESSPIESGRFLRDYFRLHPEKDFQFVEFKNASHQLLTPGKEGDLDFIASLQPWFKGDPQAFHQD